MTTTPTQDKRYRILSLDGGGIYGLFSILMLRQLCRGDDHVCLLENGCGDLLAGTGAGAINALILAKYEDPRDGLDEAVEFWSDERLYRNSALWSMATDFQGWMSILASPASPQEKYDQSMRYWDGKRSVLDPWNAWTEMLGMGSWYGANDVLSVLRNHFDGLRLGDLKQNVLITAFDWSGDADAPTNERHWKPKVYYNFPDSEKDRRSSVVDVAMSAMSWMFNQPVYNSEQGGEWYAPDPTMCAVVKAVNFISEKLRTPITRESFEERWKGMLADVSSLPGDWRHRQWAAQALRYRITDFFEDVIAEVEDEAYKYLLQLPSDSKEADLMSVAFPYLEFIKALARSEDDDVDVRVLRHLSVLSVGTGAKVPYLPVETAEWGYQTWSSGVPNPDLQQWIAPMQYVYFQPSTEMTGEQCQWLLNDPEAPATEDRYRRLNPQVFETPVLTTMMNLRNNPGYLAALLREMDQHSTSAAVRAEIKTALGWMQAQGWLDKACWATNPL
jgi:hypothetical protein